MWHSRPAAYSFVLPTLNLPSNRHGQWILEQEWITMAQATDMGVAARERGTRVPNGNDDCFIVALMLDSQVGQPMPLDRRCNPRWRYA